MRRSDTLIKLLSVIILIAIVCYMGFHLADSLLNPLQTTIAVNSRITTSGAIEGFVVREEQTLTSSGIVSPAENGKKVAAGGVVAVTYAKDDALARADRILEIDTRTAHLESIVKGTAEGSVSQALVSLSSTVNHRNLEDLDAILYDAKYTLFGKGSTEDDPMAEIAALKAERDELASQNSGYTYITAQSSGIFSSSTDGFENISYDSISGLSPSSLTELFSKPKKAANTFGKLVTGNVWYFAAVMSAEDAAKLTVGDTAQIEFTKNYTNTLSMTVVSFSPTAGGKCVVIFACSSAMADMCNVRELTGEVIFSSQSGILCPKTAVYTDEDASYIYLLMGLQAQRVDIEIICDYNEHYYLIEAAEGEILNEGAEIIIRGKNLEDGKVVK